MIISVLSGALITGSILLITSIPAFWMLDSSALRSIFYGNMSRFAEYPLSIFGKLVQVILTVVVPFAFVTFFPALAILDKQDYLFFPTWISYISPLVAAILFTIAYKFWFYGLRRYDSAGS